MTEYLLVSLIFFFGLWQAKIPQKLIEAICYRKHRTLSNFGNFKHPQEKP